MILSKTKLILVCLIVILFSSQACTQKKLSIDRIPIDTSKWKATDTLFLKLNDDEFDDLVLVYNKYKGMVRPNNIQAPILVFLAKKRNEFTFFKEADQVICLPDFKVTASAKYFQILQKGIGSDVNWYTIFCRFEENDIKVYRELVEEHIVKLKTDNKTGAITESQETNSIYAEEKPIPFDKYNSMDVISKFKN